MNTNPFFEWSSNILLFHLFFAIISFLFHLSLFAFILSLNSLSPQLASPLNSFHYQLSPSFHCPLSVLSFSFIISPFPALLFYFPFTSKPPLHCLSSLCLLSSSLSPSLFKTSISQGQVELMVFLTSLNLLRSSLCRHTYVHKRMHTLPEGIVSKIDLCA